MIPPIVGMTQAELEAYRKGGKSVLMCLHAALHATSENLGDYTWSLEELCVVILGFEPVMDRTIDRAIREQS